MGRFIMIYHSTSYQLSTALMLLSRGGEAKQDNNAADTISTLAKSIENGRAISKDANRTPAKTGSENSSQGASSYYSSWGSGSVFQAKIIEITKLDPGSNENWEAQKQLARDRMNFLIGGVQAANLRFHQLERNDISDETMDVVGKGWLKRNNQLLDHIDKEKERTSRRAEYNMETYLEIANFGKIITRKENGEYKINAFKVNGDDGKILSELTEDGRYIEYNLDGTQGKIFSRREVASFHHTHISGSEYATLMSGVSDDKVGFF